MAADPPPEVNISHCRVGVARSALVQSGWGSEQQAAPGAAVKVQWHWWLHRGGWMQQWWDKILILPAYRCAAAQCNKGVCYYNIYINYFLLSSVIVGLKVKILTVSASIPVCWIQILPLQFTMKLPVCRADCWVRSELHLHLHLKSWPNSKIITIIIIIYFVSTFHFLLNSLFFQLYLLPSLYWIK